MLSLDLGALAVGQMIGDHSLYEVPVYQDRLQW